jgi:hypothetical protein
MQQYTLKNKATHGVFTKLSVVFTSCLGSISHFLSLPENKSGAGYSLKNPGGKFKK